MSNKYSMKKVNLRKFYIVTKPTRLSEISFDDYDNSDTNWREKARLLRARRWRRIRHQLA